MNSSEYKIEASVLYKRNIKISKGLWKVYLLGLFLSFFVIFYESII